MTRLVRWLDQLWFAPAPALRLGVVRWVTGLYCLWYLVHWRRHLVRVAGGQPEVFQPIGVASFLSEPLSSGMFNDLLAVCIFLCGLFTAGACYRVVAPLFAGLFLFVLSYSNSWAMVYHTENMLILHVIILAATPSAAALSLDASYTKENPKLTRFGFTRATSGEFHPRYGWPLRLLALGATLPYVVAGVAKVRGDAGWNWALGTNLRDQITMNGLYYEVLRKGAEPITYHVYGWDWAFMIAAGGTLVLELGAPLALLHRKIGYVFVVGVMMMHWNILILMGIPFRYQLWGCAFACFVPWERVAHLLRPLYFRLKLNQLVARL